LTAPSAVATAEPARGMAGRADGSAPEVAMTAV
jgi:hypothetical protein